MTDIDNNKLIELLIIAGGGLLQSQEHIMKGENKDRKRDSKRKYYSIIAKWPQVDG